MTPGRLETTLEREAEREHGADKPSIVGGTAYAATSREFLEAQRAIYRRGVADGKKIRDAERAEVGDDGKD